MSMVKVYVPADTTSCALGADDVAAEVALQAEKKGLDVEIIRNGSRGAFWLEPLLEVESAHGRIAYGPVTTTDVAGLFASGFPGPCEHHLSLGNVMDIEWLARQDRLTFERAGQTDPLSLNDYKAHGGFHGLSRALEMSPAAIVDTVTASGLRGRGGAAFPTGIKWRTVLDTPAGQKYVIANADEGDSGTFADRLLMEADPYQLIEGMTICAMAVGATEGYIYLRSEYPKALQVLKHAIASAMDANLLGDDICGSGRDFHIHIRVGAGAYICGEETSLLESLEGKRGLVRFKPPLPAIEGLFGKPTVVNNVLTLSAVTTVLAHGSDYYRDYGSGRSRGTLTVQLAGNIRRGGLVEIPFGANVRELVENFGGGTASGTPVRASRGGGPRVAYLPESLWDKMNSAEIFNINLDKHVRTERIVAEYGRFTKNELLSSLAKIKTKLGNLNYDKTKEFINNENLSPAVSILLEYYDKAYFHSLKTNRKNKPHNIELTVNDPVTIAKEILKKAEHLSQNHKRNE